ncbi:hypothetical protein EHF33_11310 [Deinococcus psychrotolerans]|uniref:Histidine phosphatase family protein n=1 Tax=Deinococcus psychrotolerans TaxID=2489213 RepID=A0A3G8YGD8_9DEIO|nr:hypothetical protein [Deinococcus psychrotolerans]AZI43257.1 hypothetical protein EHF33_11310 [Deinococcus psychrotolerans]
MTNLSTNDSTTGRSSFAVGGREASRTTPSTERKVMMSHDLQHPRCSRRTFLEWAGLGFLSLPAASSLQSSAKAAQRNPAPSVAAPKIMLIRHAEKPNADVGSPLGITAAGQPDPKSLTVRGWQRAGALAQLFSQAPLLGEPHFSALAQPTRLFASAIGQGSTSQRPAETLMPLAERLSLTLEQPYLKTQTDLLGQMLGAAARKGGAQGAVLVAWEHALISEMVQAITGQPDLIPAQWPDQRFDLIWVLDWQGGSQYFSLTQVDQRLLAGDIGL